MGQGIMLRCKIEVHRLVDPYCGALERRQAHSSVNPGQSRALLLFTHFFQMISGAESRFSALYALFPDDFQTFPAGAIP
jgi:hypothetical protein